MLWMLVIIAAAVAVAAGAWYGLRPVRVQQAVSAWSVSEAFKESGTKVSEVVRDSGTRVSHVVKSSRDTVSEAASTSRTKVTGALTGAWRRLLGRRHGGDMARQFQLWVAGCGLPDHGQFYQDMPRTARAFSDWLVILPPERLELFSQRVAEVVSGWDIDLVWLVGQNLSRVPALKRTVEESVFLHCLAYWKATQAQDEIRTFVTFQAWQLDPYADKQKELNQKLYANLVDKGLLAAAPPDLLLAPEDRRQDYVVQALRQVSEANTAAFSLALQEISASMRPAPALVEPEAPPPASARKKHTRSSAARAASPVGDGESKE